MILVQVSQNLTNIRFVADIIQTLTLVVSLIYAAIQIRDGTRAVKSQAYQSITAAYANIEARIGQNTEIAKIYHVGCKYPDKLNDEEKVRFTQLMSSTFSFFENLHYQYKNTLLEESMWAGWCKLMIARLEIPGVKKYWEDNSYMYSKDFRQYVDSGKCPRN